MAKFHILAVSENQLYLESIKQTLKSDQDIAVYSAQSSGQMIEVINSQCIKIIIVDEKVQGVSGIEILGRINKKSPDIIRILLTSATDEQEILGAINLGYVYGYLTKPWTSKEMQTIIRQAKKYFNLTIENRSLTAELKNKNELLEKKNLELKRFGELKNQFMVVSSHELRTPATIISGALELLWDQKELFDESQQKLLKNALQGSLRLNDIISTFFETLKWNTNQNILDTSTVDIDVLLRMVVERFTPFLEQRKLSVQQKIDKNLSILGDRKKLYLVFENLMSNAIKYTPDNGKIILKAFRKKMKIYIVFEDSGIGIPNEELNNIFNPFYQLGELKYHHSSRHEFMGGGTGLGLSLCKSIILAHQGEIKAESSGKNKGSLFRVNLPFYK